jgi:hypothetical protein
MVWMPENGGGRDARSMAPTTASAPPLVGYLVSNCSSGFKPAFFNALPTEGLVEVSEIRYEIIS